jgi:hypothetical protein
MGLCVRFWFFIRLYEISAGANCVSETPDSQSPNRCRPTNGIFRDWFRYVNIFFFLLWCKIFSNFDIFEYSRVLFVCGNLSELRHVEPDLRVSQLSRGHDIMPRVCPPRGWMGSVRLFQIVCHREFISRMIFLVLAVNVSHGLGWCIRRAIHDAHNDSRRS